MDCDCIEPCAMADRFTPATRELMVFTKSAKRYFDLDAVREPFSRDYVGGRRGAAKFDDRPNGSGYDPAVMGAELKMTHAGAPPLDWWQIPSPKPQPIAEYEGDPMSATFYVGDAIETMNKLPEKSVDLILTSPPFLALRSYLPADHPDKALEGGSQSTPGEFIDWLLDVAEACNRVLAPHGSLCIELGDTYAGSNSSGVPFDPGRFEFEGDTRDSGETPGGYAVDTNEKYERIRGKGFKQGVPNLDYKQQGGGTGWPLAKSLSLIPESFRWAMVYGRNPHTGRTTDPWRLRNVVRWVRPNPPVGALGDKFRPATSELMVFCKSAKRYFDLDAVREAASREGFTTRDDRMRTERSHDDGYKPERVAIPSTAPPLDWWNIPLLEGEEETRYGPKPERPYDRPNLRGKGSGPKGHAHTDTPNMSDHTTNPLGAPPLDWWEIPPGGYEGAHYACVDEETEALTRDGWKSHKELMDGDEIAAYDLPTDRIVWQSAKFVRYDVEGEELVSIEKEQTSQRLTLNHRMLVQSRKKGPFVKLAGDVTSGYDLPLSAPWGEDGGINGPGAVYAAIFGWFITEGSARPLSRQAYIYQSQTANPAKVEEIRRLLEWSRAPFEQRTRDRTEEFPGKGVQSVFVIHDSPLARWLREHHKHLPMEYVFEWPEKDAQALFDAMVDGDGHRRADGRISFVQKDKALADAFQALAIRLGYRAIVKPRPDNGIFTVYVSVNRWVTLRGPDGKRAPIPREVYTGTVWCPLVPSTFWLARRNGKPFITGNTFPPELCVKPVKAMCPEKVCRTCGEPSRRIVEVGYTSLEDPAKNHLEPTARADYPLQQRNQNTQGMTYGRATKHVETLGFSDCGHDDWRPGLVLDPFAGSGTTLAVATGHGRDAIGIDLDDRNVTLAQERVGPFFFEVIDARPQSDRPDAPILEVRGAEE